MSLGKPKAHQVRDMCKELSGKIFDNDLLYPKSGLSKRYSEKPTSGRISINGKSNTLKTGEEILNKEATTEEFLTYRKFKHGKFKNLHTVNHAGEEQPVEYIEDFRDIKEINQMLRDMVEVEAKDDGLRRCPYRFLGSRPNQPVESRYHGLSNKTLLHKCGNYLVLMKREITWPNGIASRIEKRLITIPFKIDKVDEEIRNKVMGWFE